MVEVVSPRARTLILVLVVSAILYVLISPLPEMSATKSVQPFALLLASLLVVPIGDLMVSFFLNARPSQLEPNCNLQAVLGCWLC